VIASVAAGLRGVLRFWYGFVIGDDWTVAAAVAAGMAGTWGLARAHLEAWWLLPAVVVLATAVSLRRTEHRG
jgi:hypothetical protein